MKRNVIFLLLAAILLAACNTAEEMDVREAWSRPTAQGGTAAAYFTIQNHTDIDDELIGASSILADAVEMHESRMENDMMTMSMVPSVPLAAGDELMFEPGGLHIMLIDIKQELKVGDQYELILHFKNHADITVNVKVKEQGGMNSDHSG